MFVALRRAERDACVKSKSTFEEDLTLIREAKNGADVAKATLLERYRPLIDSLALQYSANLPEEEREDLTQEASIAFFRALEQYDPERGIAFGYFAKICISNRLIGYLRKKMNSPTEGAVSFEEVTLTAEDDPSKPLRDSESYEALRRRIQELLSDFEYRVWMLFFAGQTAKEIAVELEKDPKSIENALARARLKIKKNLPRH